MYIIICHALIAMNVGGVAKFADPIITNEPRKVHCSGVTWRQGIGRA